MLHYLIMQTLIFTGSAGGSIGLAAAATAAIAARAGTRTLLASIGPVHTVGTLVGAAVGNEPQPIAPNLDAWALDSLGDLNSLWEELRGRASIPWPGPSVSGDELPLLPGSDLFLGVARLRRLAANGYTLICIDAGTHDGLLRALAVPDNVRWLVRLFLGLDRGPGRSTASMSRALLPGALIPFEWVGRVQEARVQLEQLRDEMNDPQRTRVRYVLRPDRGGLEDARVAVPALQLYGLAVDALIAGPLLPAEISAPAIADLLAEQRQVSSEAGEIWSPRPLHRLWAGATPGGLSGLEGLGAALYAGGSPLSDLPVAHPVQIAGPPDPNVALNLPGLPREALGLTLSGDELIVRAGSYRRHILLPEGLRGTTNIRASRQGDTLIIRPR